MNSGISQSINSKGGILNLPHDNTKGNIRQLYNLSSLLNMVKDGQQRVCITSDSTKMDLYWNDAKFR